VADLAYISHYPFSAEAKEFIRSRKITFDYDSMESAKQHIRGAISRGELERAPDLTSALLEREVVNYALARAILSAMGSRYFAARYAVAKSKQIGKYLQREDEGTLAKVAGEFGVELFAGSGNKYELHFADYLRFAPKAREYKLVQKSLKGGSVQLSRNEIVRVLEEAARLHIEEASSAAKDAPPEIRKAAEELKQSLPREVISTGIVLLSEDSYPPCVVKLLERLRNSDNLPHVARFYLTTFLLNTGMKVEEVIKVFMTAPDFNEATTRYQVEYIAKRGYKVPACSGVESYGICVAACRVGSPLRYAKRKAASAERTGGQSG
jgi:DNA primase large subunit